YHMADRTSRPSRLSSGDIDLTDPTRVEDHPLGAHGARRISSLIGESRGVPQEMDLSSELDTRQRPRIPSDELRKITEPPPAAPPSGGAAHAHRATADRAARGRRSA